MGEALTQLSQRDQPLFGEIEQAPRIVSFRNKLTHEYITINNQLVWGVIKNNLPALVDQCRQLLARLDRELP
ncbi:MAG: DUF86 domain-containing protein [Vulcanococcus sp.]